MVFNRDKCKVLHLSKRNVKSIYSMGGKELGDSTREKVLGLIVDPRFNMSQQCRAADKKDNKILGCIKTSIKSRSKETAGRAEDNPRRRPIIHDEEPGGFTLHDLCSCRVRQQDEQKTIREDAQSFMMKNLVALLCMISALVGSVFSVKCKYCEGSSPNCKETVIDCPTDGCMTTSEWMFFRGEVKKFLLKGCKIATYCGRNNSDVSGTIMLKSIDTCCNSDMCNNGTYAFKELEPLEILLMDLYALCHPKKGKARKHK
ncbi:uncharacterized protein ACNLHF_003088 [Anomaloglossus baeobatrachus]|uniref:uncharacterized protein LOC142256727 n=1 Tax=Anomaloglossus baeobatrachus TaxID=238106 RepID=UPI003F504EA9